MMTAYAANVTNAVQLGDVFTIFSKSRTLLQQARSVPAITQTAFMFTMLGSKSRKVWIKR